MGKRKKWKKVANISGGIRVFSVLVQPSTNQSAMKYKIAYTYTLMGTVEVEASSLEEAKELAIEASVDNQQNEKYVDDSFEVNEEMTKHLN